MQRALENQSITVEQAAILLTEKDQLIESQSDIIEKKSSIISAQKRRIEVLEEYLRLERARLYGRSSEKNPHQGEIFDEAELLHCHGDEDDAIEDVQSTEKTKKKAGRRIG